MKPLAEYGRKRNFKVTSEPGLKVKAAARSKKLLFVVQEHHASHLHYDFRLEWQGVLKSWAIPKGPSLDPAQRRLAVEVEDHPYDYAKFTGTIPKGEYGGGEVYRWDMGTWKPEGDADKGLKKGHLEFSLNGDKLNGRFMLIRTRARTSGKAQWLLIKRHDEFAVEGDELVPASAETKQAATKKKAPRMKAANVKSARPEFVPPQLAQLAAKPPTGADWVHEVKYDGYRIQAHIVDHKVKLFTRNGHDWTEKYKGLAKLLTKAKVESAVLDGELVWQDAEGRSDFQNMQKSMKAGKTDELVYWVFDLLHLNGKDLTSLPLIARKDRLEKIVHQVDDPHFRYSEHFRESGAKILSASCRMHLEGIVSKRVDATYMSGRRDAWVKAKCTQRQEFVIGGFTEGTGTRQGFGALLLGVYENEKLRYVGRVGTGFDQDLLTDIGKRLHRNESQTSPFEIASPRGRDIHWVKPKLVAEVAFAEWTAEKILRTPVFHGLRSDKGPKEIGLEKEKDVVRPKGRAKAKAKAASEAEPAKVSHPDRVIYPKEKLTKQDVADYYQLVAPLMEPHLVDRPLSLLRCTESATAACFFAKHFPFKLPEGLVEVPERGKQPFIALAEQKGIAALVQFGTLEFHPWNCHRDKVELPDQIVLDFDPDPKVDFATVKEGAFEVRDLLTKLGLKSFVKVTGGKGVHVQFPFERKHDWDVIKNFSKTIVLEMVSRHPDLYTANVSKKARPGKIFLDYLRNGRGATAVAPYSLRARPLSAVAMPLTWEELKKLKSADHFSLTVAKAYLKKRKVDPWKDYFKTKQKINLLD